MPTFKELSELRRSDIQDHPFWIWCEMEDENEHWYSQIESSTFRNYTGKLPIGQTCGVCRTTVVFSNRKSCDGLAFFNGETLESHELFVGEDRVMLRFKDTDGTNSDAKNAATLLETGFLDSLGRLFPITVKSAPGILATPVEAPIQCLKSIATHDGSLLETNMPESAG